MCCEFCGCDCCDEEPEWDGKPIPPPAEGTIERIMYDKVARMIPEMIERDSTLYSLFRGK
jgi:hypothetical protein